MVVGGCEGSRSGTSGARGGDSRILGGAWRINAVRWAVGGTCDAANKVTSPWAGLLEIGAGFVTQKGQF